MGSEPNITATEQRRRDSLLDWPRPGIVFALGALLYVGWAVNMTWPLFSDPSHMVLGGLGDQTGGIAGLREQIKSGVVPFLPGTVHDLNAPDGLAVPWGVDLGSWPWLLPVWLAALVVGPTAAYALATLFGFALSGLSMQVLSYRLTHNHAAAVVAGFAFAFYPYALVKSGSHVTFVHGWPLALLAWRQLELFDQPGRRNTILACGAAILAVAFTSYYVLIGGVLLGCCAALTLFMALRRGGTADLLGLARAQLVVCGAAALYLVTLAALTIGSGGGALRAHPLSQVTDYAARWHEYLVPFPRSMIFGTDTAAWIGRHQHGSNGSETTLYLGVVMILLACVGVIVAVRRTSSPRLRWGAIAALFIIIAGVYWSAPPEISLGPVTIPSPSQLVIDFTTTWRVYARFVVMVMLGVALLASIGIAGMLSRARTPVVALVGLVLLSAVAVDFWWRPGALRIQAPPIYGVLRAHPGGIVAQYPLLPAGYGDSSELFWQDAQSHPIINGYAEGTYQEFRASTLYYVKDPTTVKALASLGVRYVLLPAANDPLFLSTPYPGPPGAGLKQIAERPNGASTMGLYRVTARPDLGFVYPHSGIDGNEGDPARPFRWIVAQGARLDVDAPRCTAPCQGKLRLHVLSLVKTRRLTISLSGGEQLWSGPVGPAGRDLVIPFAAGHHSELIFDTDPGPIPIPQVLPGNPDTRSVSVQISDLSYSR